MQPLVAITANDIDPSGMAVDAVLPAQWITARLGDEQFYAPADGRFTGRLSRSGKADIVVRGVVEATVDMPCARCLMPARIPVRGELALLLKPKPSTTDLGRIGLRPGEHAPYRANSERRAERMARGKPHRTSEYEFTSEEADVDDYDGESVVLDPFVRDAILLELPNFPLCSESCPGISSGPNNWPEMRVSSPGKTSPFEALRHLRPSLAEAGSTETSPTEGAVPARSGGAGVNGIELGRRSTGKKNETKIASTHAAPRRRPSAKKTSRVGKRGKRP